MSNSAVDLFLKSDDDDFTSIDFLAELDKDEKMYFDGESKVFNSNLAPKSSAIQWLGFST